MISTGLFCTEIGITVTVVYKGISITYRYYQVSIVTTRPAVELQVFFVIYTSIIGYYYRLIGNVNDNIDQQLTLS